MRFLLQTLFLVFAFREVSLAGELTQLGEDTRSFGMGGVRIAAERGGTFLWNPGYLGLNSGLSWEVVDVGVGVNGIQAYNDFKDVNFNGLSSFSNLYGKRLWLGLQGYSAFSIGRLGVGVYNSGYTDFQLNNPAFPVLDMTVINDYGFALGWGVALTNEWGAGVNFKRIVRQGGPQKIGAQTLNSIQGGNLSSLRSQFSNTGSALAADFGIAYRSQMFFHPSLSIAWQDLGATTFLKTAGSQAPPRIEDNLTVAATFDTDLPLVGLAGGVEYRHVLKTRSRCQKKFIWDLKPLC